MKNLKKKVSGACPQCLKHSFCRRGFTLIELLVVVAIISMLAAVVFSYLGAARKEGDETAVKSNLATTRTSAELFYLNNGATYLPSGDTINNGTCPSYSSTGLNMFSRIKEIAASIAEAVGRGKNGSYCYNDKNVWSVAVGTTSTTSWCVDVSGAARLVNFTPANSVNTTTHLCK